MSLCPLYNLFVCGNGHIPDHLPFIMEGWFIPKGLLAEKKETGSGQDRTGLEGTFCHAPFALCPLPLSTTTIPAPCHHPASRCSLGGSLISVISNLCLQHLSLSPIHLYIGDRKPPFLSHSSVLLHCLSPQILSLPLSLSYLRFSSPNDKPHSCQSLFFSYFSQNMWHENRTDIALYFMDIWLIYLCLALHGGACVRPCLLACMHAYTFWAFCTFCALDLYTHVLSSPCHALYAALFLYGVKALSRYVSQWPLENVTIHIRLVSFSSVGGEAEEGCLSPLSHMPARNRPLSPLSSSRRLSSQPWYLNIYRGVRQNPVYLWGTFIYYYYTHHTTPLCAFWDILFWVDCAHCMPWDGLSLHIFTHTYMPACSMAGMGHGHLGHTHLACYY